MAVFKAEKRKMGPFPVGNTSSAGAGTSSVGAVPGEGQMKGTFNSSYTKAKGSNLTGDTTQTFSKAIRDGGPGGD